MSTPAGGRSRRPVRPGALLEAVARRRPRYLTDLERLVGLDCGSYDADGVDAAGRAVAERMEQLGFAVQTVPVGPDTEGRRLGHAVVGRCPGRDPGGRRLLLMAHLDTVYERGTAAARPFRISAAADDNTAYGPGVTDDKGGLLLGLLAVGALRDLGADDWSELVFLCTPDEEIGSPGSRPLTEALAAEADFGFCLECARENGDIVTGRKGVVDLRITVHGRAAHSGVEPERGASAALAAAHLVVALQGLNSRDNGVTVNVGRVRAGSRVNVVCEEATLDVEVRAGTRAALAGVRNEIGALVARTWVAGTSAGISTGEECPPMEETWRVTEMAAEAVRLADGLGFRLGTAVTGGVADANFASGAGIPVLDGLGPVGGGDHSPGEWLDLSSVVPRGALLAGLLATFGAAAPSGVPADGQ